LITLHTIEKHSYTPALVAFVLNSPVR